MDELILWLWLLRLGILFACNFAIVIKYVVKLGASQLFTISVLLVGKIQPNMRTTNYLTLTLGHNN